MRTSDRLLRFSQRSRSSTSRTNSMRARGNGFAQRTTKATFETSSRSRIVGFVGVRDNKHLYHLFVANDFQRRGVARRLWTVAREECIAAGNPGTFTVNSSNNAVAAYERLGFVRSGPTKNDDGVLYNPMATR